MLPLICPACGGELRIIAFLTPPEPVTAILDRLGLPSRPPPLAPARSPPELAFAFGLGRSEFDFDQTPAFDRGPRATRVAWGEGPTDPEPAPEFEFDQRRRT